mgnify:CR=1 FL=1
MNEENKTPEKSSDPQAPAMDMTALVHQLEDLVRLALECEKKELAPNVSFPEVNAQLKRLKETIDLLNKSYLDTLHSLSLSEDDVAEFRKSLQETGGPEQKLLSTLTQLQTSCEQARDRVYTSLLGSREQIKDLEALGDENATKKRRKSKFKSMGGRKGWLPT